MYYYFNIESFKGCVLKWKKNDNYIILLWPCTIQTFYIESTFNMSPFNFPQLFLSVSFLHVHVVSRNLKISSSRHSFFLCNLSSNDSHKLWFFFANCKSTFSSLCKKRQTKATDPDKDKSEDSILPPCPYGSECYRYMWSVIPKVMKYK